MLENLDKIQWSQLQHAYGNAEDVPGLLCDLLSESKRVRSEAIHSFFGNIWHQGTIYQATSYAVPFLIEIAREGPPENLVDILSLLAEIAKGMAESGEGEFEVACFDALRLHKDHFLSLLLSKSNAVTVAATSLLLAMNEPLDELLDFVCKAQGYPGNYYSPTSILLLGSR
jgi:hypothetical protein